MGKKMEAAMMNFGASIFNDFVAGMGTVLTQADSMQASFNAMSGQAGAMNDILLESHRGMGSLGVGMQEVGAATSSLYQNFNQFSGASKQMQTQMVQTGAGLQKLGVDADTFANNMDLAVNAFGMGTSEAVGLQDELAKTAMSIGMPPAKLAQEFSKAAPQLSAYGTKGIEVFKNMAAASKGLGIEMGTLLDLTSQFDTFEGAATAAGNLNSMLGGDLLNSMDLLNATEDERIRMILQATDASGKQWSTMGKFEKMAIANAAGIKDMAEANKLFGGGLKGYDDAIAKMEENKVAEEELAAAKAAASSITDKATMMMQQMAVAIGPLINAIHFVLDGVLSLNDAFGGYLIPVVMGGIAALYLLVKVMNTVRAVTGAVAMGKKIMAGATVAEASASAAAATGKGIETTACGALTTCTQINTAAKGANTTATNVSAMATLRDGAAKAASH